MSISNEEKKYTNEKKIGIAPIPTQIAKKIIYQLERNIIKYI